VNAKQQGHGLAELRDAAADRRQARRHIAATHGRGSTEQVAAWDAYRAVNERWSALIRQTASAGHTLADVARAAGCARPSLYRHLRG
jgi:DNA-binding phage protein